MVAAALVLGITFPADAQGGRSSTSAGTAILAAALAPLSADAAAAAAAETRWRRNYPAHFRALVAHALPRTELALASAQAGLQAAHGALVWQPAEGGAERPLAQAMAEPQGAPLGTHTLRGTGAAAPAPWRLPLRGEWLEGDALLGQLARWVEAGVIEPSAAQALSRCVAHPEWFDLSDRTIALLGAGSEAGPLRWLSRWRANLLAVDINRPAVWQRLAATVVEGNATLHLPLQSAAVADGSDWTAHAGADLLSDTPRIAQWLVGWARPLDLLSLAYLDGERHLRVSLAMDLIAAHLLAAQPSSTLGYLATPTDVFAVPEAAALAGQGNYRERPWLSRGLQSPLHLATGDRFFQPHYGPLVDGPAGQRWGVSDSLVIEQGPNYALAKRLQQWRAITARAAGHRVSLNVAPSTTTASVVKNPALAAGFAGADRFGIEVFEPDTTNALMAALWVHDLRCTDAAANPAQPLNHPFELFMDQACHGGLWRSGYLPRSALPFAAALGWVRQRAGR